MAGLDGCGKLDISEMSPDNVVAIGNKVWVKAEVEEKIWIYSGKPCVVIKFDDACIAGICDDAAAIPKAIWNAAQNANILDCGGAAAGGGEQGGGEEEEDPCAGGCSENPDDPCYQPGGCGEAEEPPPEGEEPTTPDTDLSTGSGRKAKSVRDELTAKKDDVTPSTTAVDLRSINARGYQGMAVIPSAAIIPMRSNNKTYGPYASSNFGTSCGGTQVEVNTDLAPWVFGSTAGMNGAGQAIVESTAIGLVKAETGSITIPGMPVSQFTQLGTALGSGGATLSGMNFSYGSGGISTSYDFRTYTPKFGGLTRHLIDRIKDISKNRTEQLRFLRNQQSNLNKIGNKLQRFDRAFGGRGLRNEGPNVRNSLQRILIGEIYDWQKDGQRTVIGVDSINDAVGEMVYDFERKAYISWDHFFGPVSKKGDGQLPRYASFDSTGHKSSPISPHPPFSISGVCFTSFDHDQYNLEITQNYMDPLTNKIGENDHHHSGEGRGHVTDIIGRNTGVPEQGLITNFYRLDDENRYSDDYRFLAMRGPLLLHSWGYDLDGKPVPNEADIENNTKYGQFKKENLKDAFLKDWLGKPATWPVAPVDLRFDRERGLWVSPQSYKIVVSKIIEEVPCFGEGKGVVIPYGKKLFDKEGAEIDTSSSTNPNNECTEGVNDIETEWVLININCDSSGVYYCYTTEIEDCYECISSNDPNSGGASGAFSGPYDTLEECQAACECLNSPTPTETLTETPTETPTQTPTPTPDDCSDGIEVITGLTLGSGGLVAQRKRIRVQCAVDIDPITIPTTDCEPPPPSEPVPSLSFSEGSPTPTPTGTPTPTPTGTPTQTPTGTPTPTPTGTPTPTPTGTPTPTPTPTPSSSSGAEPTPIQADVTINIVDRIGRKHRVGELVYAYYDTSTEKYIVLEKHPEPLTPTIFGRYKNGKITVEYAAGMDFCTTVYKGSVYDVVDKLGLVNDPSQDCPAVAVRMEKLKPPPQ